uniref:Helix-turn-helix domain-containing protein n=1 Tax=Prevotella sp. GTC17262 TaxID=3236797 RepID=A0AB33JE40_9BACT
MISIEQEENVVLLYKENKHTIKQIMSLTGVRSEQTIYRILNSRGIPRQAVRKPTRRITVCLDFESDKIIQKLNPKNLSEFVCEAIKAFAKH